MGIAPYKTFTFDGVSSSAYGVYLTGEGVFNAPERDVEMIEIHGRNGAYAFDNGRFKNISVTYKAGMFDVNESNFATKISNFRNWLCSKVGYCRLEDDYNPNEYRMAVFKSGVTVDHDFLMAGEFEITFECKPQRWLTSGETATAVANNGTLSNPTLFDSSPLLAVEGYGTIDFNGYEVEIDSVVIGEYTIADTGSYSTLSKSFTYEQGLMNNGDSITVSIADFRNYIHVNGKSSGTKTRYHTSSLTDSNASFNTNASGTSSYSLQNDVSISTGADNIVFTAGTDSTVTDSVSGTVTVRTSSSTDISITVTATRSVAYVASTRTITVSMTCSASTISTAINVSVTNPNLRNLAIKADSTMSALGHPTYIDCDIGECYMYNSGGDIITLNDVISLGSDLPTLAQGTNTFTYDNTVTSFKVTPRWWRV